MILAVMVVVIIAVAMLLPVKKLPTLLVEWTTDLGPWGPPVIVALYGFYSIFLVPVWPLCIGSGLGYSFIGGVTIASAGGTFGAWSAFLVGRTFGKKWIEKKVTAHPRFEAIDEAVSRKGFTIVLLTRLSPLIPWNISNYAFSLTRVPFWKYALASWIGMLPVTIMYVYIGTTIGSLSDASPENVDTGVAGKILCVGGLVATVVVTVLVTIIARNALHRAAAPQTDESPIPTAAD